MMVRTSRHISATAATLVLAMCLPTRCWGDTREPDASQSWGTDTRIGGVGGVYFLASPGEFWVEVEKCDLNMTARRTQLRAILFAPNRSIIDDQTIPDDMEAKGSGAGPVQRVTLAASVPRTGIYGLNVTVTDDRYGEDVAWGFRTNCPRYLVETSRGHRDAPHEEPLVLLNPDAPGDVCFMPRRADFSVDVTGLPKGVDTSAMYDAKGEPITTLDVAEDGKAACRFAAGVHREAVPWRLHLPNFMGVVHIDGVTRWTDDDDFPDLSLWTPRIESWFPFHENRWLLTPYSRTVYGEPGADGSVTFSVYNNGWTEKRVALDLEFPDNDPWSVELSQHDVTLGPKESAPVTVRYRVPERGGDSWTCRVCVTPTDDAGVSTYSTLNVRTGVAPATQPVALPLVLKPYRHENEQLGYLPGYPVTNEVYFDRRNQPVITSKTGVSTYGEGGWNESTSSKQPDGTVAPFRLLSSKVAFDQDNDMYLVGEQGGMPMLLHSRDGGKTFDSCPIPGKGAFDIEQFSGHNLPEGPPPLTRFTLTAKDPDIFWRRLNDLALLLPEKRADGALHIGEPIPLSKQCIGLSAHSGIPASIVSRGSKVHVVWGEATDPAEKAPGVPTFVVTYDRETALLGKPALVGYGPPANDVHNAPCIAMDSQGCLHVLVGTHGRTFKYARSLLPNDAGGGWTEAEDVGPGLQQTYVGLVCDPSDTLHLVFRLWRHDDAYFPIGNYAALTYMSKRAGEPWSQPQAIIVPPFSEYSVFYHRLTIDRAGRLFLSYDYWSTFWFYRTDHHGSRRALMTSPDRGLTWKLAQMSDLAPPNVRGSLVSQSLDRPHKTRFDRGAETRQRAHSQAE